MRSRVTVHRVRAQALTCNLRPAVGADNCRSDGYLRCAKKLFGAFRPALETGALSVSRSDGHLLGPLWKGSAAMWTWAKGDTIYVLGT